MLIYSYRDHCAVDNLPLSCIQSMRTMLLLQIVFHVKNNLCLHWKYLMKGQKQNTTAQIARMDNLNFFILRYSIAAMRIFEAIFSAHNLSYHAQSLSNSSGVSIKKSGLAASSLSLGCHPQVTATVMTPACFPSLMSPTVSPI